MSANVERLFMAKNKTQKSINMLSTEAKSVIKDELSTVILQLEEHVCNLRNSLQRDMEKGINPQLAKMLPRLNSYVQAVEKQKKLYFELVKLLKQGCDKTVVAQYCHIILQSAYHVRDDAMELSEEIFHGTRVKVEESSIN
jgi:hypothetical protein